MTLRFCAGKKKTLPLKKGPRGKGGTKNPRRNPLANPASLASSTTEAEKRGEREKKVKGGKIEERGTPGGGRIKKGFESLQLSR